tara:strand:- start:1081 stop:2055 length:975 start_codon:yes stop_codon:yes gene_type:complete
MRKIIALTICSLFLVGSNNAELVIAKDNKEWDVGDYVKYEIMGDGFATRFGQSMGGEDYLRIENFNAAAEERVIGRETIEFNNQTYDCNILKESLSFSFTVVFKEGTGVSDNEKMKFEMEYEYNEWQENIFNTLKSEYSFTYSATWLEYGETRTYERINEEDDSYTNHQGSWPESFEVGSSWTHSKNIETISTSRERFDDEEWEVTVDEYDMTETADYVVTDEAIVTTSAGTFDTLVVEKRKQEEGVGNYTLEYINSDFLSVKRVAYTDGEILVTMQIKQYNIKSIGSSPSNDDSDSDMGLPNLSFLLSIASIGSIAIFNRNRL